MAPKLSGPWGRCFSGIGPVQLEQIAQAVSSLGDNSYDNYLRMLPYITSAPDDKGAQEQARYSKNYASAMRHLASMIRALVPRAGRADKTRDKKERK